MAITDADLKKIRGVVEETINGEQYMEKIGKVVGSNITEALEQVVFPKFDELEAKIATKDDIHRLEKRIDKLAEVVTDVKVNHEKRIRKLESEVGVETPARLNY
ncbi:hypothetical protein HYS10_00455 [Candidatus Collierbacteria bacterium]|nr:hypothetical protein [Candidatus Collierbacteria bacterium]